MVALIKVVILFSKQNKEVNCFHNLRDSSVIYNKYFLSAFLIRDIHVV